MASEKMNRWRVVWKRQNWAHKKAKSFGAQRERAERFAAFIRNEPERAYPGFDLDRSFCRYGRPNCPYRWDRIDGPGCDCTGSWREHCQAATDAMVDSGALEFCQIEGRDVSSWRRIGGAT